MLQVYLLIISINVAVLPSTVIIDIYIHKKYTGFVMNAILLDDDRIANRHLKRLIDEDGRLCVAKSFVDAQEALTYCEENEVSFVFADIEIPGMDGILFGKQLKNYRNESKLVYITAYSQYTLQAYQNYAVGYLLKPVSQDHLSKLLDNLIGCIKQQTISACCLGNTSVFCHGQPVKFRINKAKELFFYLLCQTDKLISIGAIIEDLWPDEDIPFAKKQLHNSLYHLRKALQPYGLDKNIVYELGAYGLSKENIEWDYDILSTMLKRYENEHAPARIFWKIADMDKGLCFIDCDYMWASHLQSSLEIKLQRFYRTQQTNPEVASKSNRAAGEIIKSRCGGYED